MNVLELRSLTFDDIPAALELDQRALGGIWKRDGYQREIESPNSDLLVIRRKAGGRGQKESGESEEGREGEEGGEDGFKIQSSLRFEDSGSRTKFKIPPPSPSPLPPSSPPPSLSPPPTPHSPLPTPYSPLLALGCSWAIAEEAHITLLAVDLQYQQQGLGQAMLYALLNAAYQRQLERATLEVRVSNEAALKLYTKFGFQTAGRRKRYYQDTGEDALVLWRGGLQHPHFLQELQQWQEQVGEKLRSADWELEFEGVGSRE